MKLFKLFLITLSFLIVFCFLPPAFGQNEAHREVVKVNFSETAMKNALTDLFNAVPSKPYRLFFAGPPPPGEISDKFTATFDVALKRLLKKCPVFTSVRWDINDCYISIAKEQAKPVVVRAPYSKPEIVVQKGHTSAVTLLEFSPDSAYLGSSSDQETIIWDIATKRLKFYFRGRMTSKPYDYSTKEKLLTTTAGTTQYIWSLETGSNIKSVDLQANTAYSDFHPEISQALVQNSPSLELKNTGTGATLWRIPQEDPNVTQHQAKLLPSKKIVVDRPDEGAGGVIKGDILNLYDSLNGQFKKKIEVGDAIQDYVVNPSQTVVATLCQDYVKVWDLQTGELKKKFAVKQNFSDGGNISSIFFSGDSKKLYTSGWQLNEFDLEKNTVISSRDVTDPIISRASSADGKLLAFANSRGEITVQNQSGETLNTFGSDSSIEFVAFDRTENTLISGMRNQLVLWDRRMEKTPIFLSANPPYLYSARSNTLVCADSNGYVTFWDLKNTWVKGEGPSEFPLKQKINAKTPVALSFDGEWLAIAEGKTIKIWRNYNSKPFMTLAPPVDAETVTFLSFCSNGNGLVSKDGDNVRIWDLNQRKVVDRRVPVTNSDLSRNWSPAVSARGDSVAWTANTRMKVFNITTKTDYPERRSYGQTPVFSPDDRFVAASDISGTVEVWDDKMERLALMPRMGFNPHFSSDGKTLFTFGDFATKDGYLNTAVGWDAPMIMLTDTRTWQPVGTLEGHHGRITSLSCSRNGERLLTGGKDSTLRLWDVVHGKEIAQFITSGKEGYVVVNSKNQYMASKDALKSVAFRYNKSLYPFSQFDLTLNRPDKVLESLGSGNKVRIALLRAAYEKRLVRANVKSSDIGVYIQAPDLEIAEKLPTSVNVPTLHLTVKAKDREYDLVSLNVFVNGSPIFGLLGMNLISEKTKEIRKEIDIPLGQLKNQIEISVTNKNGISSPSRTFSISYPKAFGLKRDLYLLCIGISDYLDTQRKLNFGKIDATDMNALFKENLKSGFNKIHPILLTDTDASKEKIKAALNELSMSHPQDTVIITYAGHGVIGGDLRFFLTTFETNFKHVTDLTAIPFDEFELALANIPAHRKLVVLDACQSGYFESAISGNSEYSVEQVIGIMEDQFSTLEKGAGAIIISACGGYSKANESVALGNSVFTKACKLALARNQDSFAPADKNRDRRVTTTEFFQYLSVKVPEMTNQLQKPTSLRENLEFEFLVAGEEAVIKPVRSGFPYNSAPILRKRSKPRGQ